jgi:hypothetical protein
MRKKGTRSLLLRQALRKHHTEKYISVFKHFLKINPPLESLSDGLSENI